jgi:oxalate decarboxylase/phosphoglucose isomerase-like protein (cupin superfamily)
MTVEPCDHDIVVTVLDDSSDERGWSFSLLEQQLSLIGKIKDMHLATIRPGSVRGNHYHAHRGELITVIFQDAWSLHWDTGEGTRPRHRGFEGSGAVSFAPPLNWSHAVRNDGRTDLMLVASSDAPYDRHATDDVRRDAIRRVVTD